MNFIETKTFEKKNKIKMKLPQMNELDILKQIHISVAVSRVRKLEYKNMSKFMIKVKNEI